MRVVIDDGTIRFYFTSNAAAGNPVAPSAAFVAADFAIYKDGSATKKTTTNGLTVTSPFDAIAGLHLLQIDCSNDTGDAGFWAVGSTYEVRLSTATTVDSLSVSGYGIGDFRIQSKADLDDLNDFNPATDTVANVTTVGTTTTNSDMRGTDSAFLASSAPANFGDLAITATDGKVTVGTNDDKSGYFVSGTITTLDGLNNFNPATDTVANVTTVATTTTNSDMRGTDSAFLASSAPANFSSLLINASGHISRVTLVDTTTANADMRGTDGAATFGQATTISSQISGLNDLSSGDISTAVWQVSLATYGGVGGSTGEGLVDDASPSASSFVTTLTAPDANFFADKILVFTSGDLRGQARIIATYNESTQEVTFDEPFTRAPADTDEFELLAIHQHTLAQILDQAVAALDTETLVGANTVTATLAANTATLGSLNDFDPATDTVARVTLVDTTSTNTDMRGTDGAATITDVNNSLSPLKGTGFDTESHSLVAIRNRGDIAWASSGTCAGDGTVQVTQDYGGTRALTYTLDSVPVGGATILIYRAEDYSAGLRSDEYVIARTTQRTDGTWDDTLLLDPGSYTLLAYLRGVAGPNAFSLTVTAE
jgi:hypothetical protein